MYKLGLKLWSINTGFYYEEAKKLYAQGIFDYIELYVVPDTLDTLPKWKNRSRMSSFSERNWKNRRAKAGRFPTFAVGVVGETTCRNTKPFRAALVPTKSA